MRELSNYPVAEEEETVQEIVKEITQIVTQLAGIIQVQVVKHAAQNKDIAMDMIGQTNFNV